ncbi:hypothetical protein [Gordonia aquimaris]|uniref:NYN domain-containing protein n=1 Tax=Gordonia aquimaris TaxID=2984863 RepID=A0A9X3D8T2_9ACTN|nr:hypothetical protein [Gordonia aquimaris]MCX2966861.1 hypothetical protein [Gordonia aquimaris]
MCITTSRKYIVVDLENLLGRDRSLEGVREVWGHLKPLITPGDQVLVASGPTLAKAAVFALAGEGVRYYVRADSDSVAELIYRVDESHAASRYSTFVICSGNGRFTEMAERARGAGLTVWQLCGRGALSRSLRDATALHGHLRLSPEPTNREFALAS